MIQQTTIVTTTEHQYTLDTIEQLCCDAEHPPIIQRWDSQAKRIVDEEIAGNVLSVVVLD